MQRLLNAIEEQQRDASQQLALVTSASESSLQALVTVQRMQGAFEASQMSQIVELPENQRVTLDRLGEFLVQWEEARARFMQAAAQMEHMELMRRESEQQSVTIERIRQLTAGRDFSQTRGRSIASRQMALRDGPEQYFSTSPSRGRARSRDVQEALEITRITQRVA